MRSSGFVLPLLFAAVNAQSATDAIQSAAEIVSLGDAALSSFAAAASTNSNLGGYSSYISQFTADYWNSYTAAIASATAAAATDSSASADLASYLSENAGAISSFTEGLGSSLDYNTVLTGSSGSAAASSLAGSLSSNLASVSSVVSSQMSSASAAATSTRNAGVNVEVGMMSAAGAAILGLAAFL